MSITLGTKVIGDAWFGQKQLAQISVGPVVVWERSVPNSIELEFDGGQADVQLPLERYLTTEWEVDWGDGTKGSNVTSHSYTDGASVHVVRVSGSALWGVGQVSNTMPASVRAGLLRVRKVVGTCPIRGWRTNSFENCVGLTSVDGNIFNGVVAYDSGRAAHKSTAWDFGGMFAGCTKLKSVGEDLLANSASVPGGVTDVYLGSMFRNSAIGSVPRLKLPGVTWSTTSDGRVRCANMFYGCKGLVAVGQVFKEFPKTVQKLDCNNMFRESGLGSICENFFAGLPGIGGGCSGYAIDLDFMFQDCTGLRGVPGTILTGVPNNSKVCVDGMFYKCTGINTAVPAVWGTHGATSHYGFYMDCTNASNYGSIAEGWK